MNRILGAVCAVAVACAASAVVLAGSAADPLVATPRSPDVVAAPSATLSCPESPATKQTSTSLLAVAPVSGIDGETPTGEGTGDVSVLSKDDPRVLDQLSTRGTPVQLELSPDDEPSVVANGSGALAPGLWAAQWSIARKDAGNGLASGLCLPPGDEWNFVAISTAVGATSRLVVTNPTPAVAVFDLTFVGPDGPVEAVGARGIALAPQSQESFDLAQFAPGVDAMALNLTVDSGRVVAAVHTDLVEGNDAVGSEWIPPTATPANEVLVNPGIADGTEQELLIANPSDREALVQVQVVAGSGPFAPTKLQDLRVPPFSVHTEKLTDITEEEAAAIHLTSTTPVTATVVDRSNQDADFAASSSSAAIVGPAVVPMIADADLTLALASRERSGGKVTVTGFAANGNEVGSNSFTFKGLTTKTWQPDKKTTDRAAYLVISLPVAFDLHGVAQFQSKDGLTSLPILSGTYTLSKPSVAPATGD